MFIPFEDIPSTARVWIYQTVRPMTEKEVAGASQLLTLFCDQWSTHGQPMKASFAIRHNYFILLAADENHLAASGCSIDDSVRTIKQIDTQFELGLFNRNLVGFLVDGDVRLIDVKDVKENFANGTLKGDSLTFNNLVLTKGQLENEWLVRVDTSWLKRYIVSQAIAS